eukprot:26368-Chlamydomonas_euryale.AAC.1
MCVVLLTSAQGNGAASAAGRAAYQAGSDVLRPRKVGTPQDMRRTKNLLQKKTSSTRLREMAPKAHGPQGGFVRCASLEFGGPMKCEGQG